VTDIFQEVEEDVRRERFEKLWKQYGDYVIAAVAAVAVGVAGFQLWTKYETRKRLEASQTFMQAQAAADQGNEQLATQTFGQLAKSGPSGYATIATFSQANNQLAAGKRTEALAIYKSLAEKDSSPIGSAARIRAAWIMVETVQKSELESWLSPLNAQSNAWHYLAQEILAYCDYRAGALDQAQREYKSLAGDRDAPNGVRARSTAMATFMTSGGDKDFGTVPRPPQPAIPGLDATGGGVAPAPQGASAPQGAPAQAAAPAQAPPAAPQGQSQP
jgi:hypothetical protein